jgi:hypothetical protein
VLMFAVAQHWPFIVKVWPAAQQEGPGGVK